jgi:hypothetical protein
MPTTEIEAAKTITIEHSAASTVRFATNAFGVPFNYSGYVVLSPGPGMELGLSAAAACACCTGTTRLYLSFASGMPIAAFLQNGNIQTKLESPITLPVTGNLYFKVSYIPGELTDIACCKCLTDAFELKIPVDSKAKTWGDLAATLKPRGTTALEIEAMQQEIAALKAQLGSGSNGASDNQNPTATIIRRVRAACCN